jgi:hypothetical protein
MEATTPANNLFSVIAAEVAKSNLKECYLLAGDIFRSSHVTPAIQKALDSTSAGYSPREALSVHYTFGDFERKEAIFSDKCGGLFDVDGVVVEFECAKVGDDPVVYRVLFSRVDAVSLRANLKAQVEDLALRLTVLERIVLPSGR